MAFLPLTINFFVKYDEFEDIPELKHVSVDNIPICFSKGSIDKRTVTNMPPQMKNKTLQEISLDNLPFYLYPNVTSIPSQVFNVSTISKN
jgi:hypothetical protein